MHNEINYDSKKDYNTRKKEAFKLIGYTIDDENVISTFDKSYADSRFIKGLKLTKNGFAAYSKLLNKNQMNNLIKLIEKNIKHASTNIIKGNFTLIQNE